MDPEEVQVESPAAPVVEYSDVVEKFTPTPEEKKAWETFEKRYREMRALADLFRRKFDKNYRYYRGWQYPKFGEAELWRSSVFVPIIFPRVQHYQARMNDRLPDIIVTPRTPDAVDKAERVRAALDYLVDVSGAKEAFSYAKQQGLTFGTGAVGVFLSDETKLVRDVVDPGSMALRPREVPVHKEALRVQRLDIYDVFLDPAASCVEDAQDCVIRVLLPTKEVRRRYYSKGSSYGKYIATGLGDVSDSRDGRMETTAALAEQGSSPPVFLQGGAIKRFNYTGNSVLPKTDMVELRYYFNIKEDTYQVWCGEVPLLPPDTPNPYDHKQIPVAIWRDIKLPGELYGLGEPDVLEPFQDMLNEIRNSRLDQVRLSTFKSIFLGPGAGIKKEDMAVGPLKVIPTRDASQVKFMDVPPVGGEIYREEELIRTDAEIASGMSDINNAAEQRATDTATGLNIQVQSAEERLNEKMRNFEDEMFKRVIGLLRENMVQFWDDQKIIAVTGEDGSIHEEVVTKDDLVSDVALDVAPASGLPPNKLAIREQFLKFFNLVAPLPNVVNDELLRMLAEQFEIKNVDDILVSIRQVKQLKHAEAENESMLRGNPAAVKEIYLQDHKLHLSKHLEVVNTTEFASLPPEMQRLFLEHIQEHQASIPAAPDTTPNAVPGESPSSELVAPSQSVPSPANVTPVNPVVNPGADSFGG